MQLIAARPPVLAPLALLLLLTAAARGENVPQNPSGEVSVRGNYWRDRNTRVLNPTVDTHRTLPSGVDVGAHYVLDAITSASVAAGVTADEPFTELRHEAGLRAEVPLSRRVRLSGSYSYSSESDYWSHNAGLRLKLNLAKDNTSLTFGGDYGNNTAAKRLGPTGYLLQGVMHSVHLVALGSQVLSRTLLGTLSYELTLQRGYLNNPYRPVFVGGERREVEKLPEERLRHVLAASLHGMVPVNGDTLRYLVFRPALRFYADSWGVKALAPELATTIGLPPVELRLLVSYLGQFGADFYRTDGVCRTPHPDVPCYQDPVVRDELLVYTSDVKLGSYSAGTFELQIKWRLSVLRDLPHLGELLGRSVVELTGGMWVADRGPGWQYNIPLRGGDPAAPAGCSLSCGAFYAAFGYVVPL
jgi:hypothetical protein